MASITARRSVLRGRPPALGGGRSGAITPTPDPSCHSDIGPTNACGRGEWSRPRPSDPPSLNRAEESQPTDITQLLFGPALSGAKGPQRAEARIRQNDHHPRFPSGASILRYFEAATADGSRKSVVI